MASPPVKVDLPDTLGDFTLAHIKKLSEHKHSTASKYLQYLRKLSQDSGIPLKDLHMMALSQRTERLISAPKEPEPTPAPTPEPIPASAKKPKERHILQKLHATDVATLRRALAKLYGVAIKRKWYSTANMCDDFIGALKVPSDHGIKDLTVTLRCVDCLVRYPMPVNGVYLIGHIVREFERYTLGNVHHRTQLSFTLE